MCPLLYLHQSPIDNLSIYADLITFNHNAQSYVTFWNVLHNNKQVSKGFGNEAQNKYKAFDMIPI